MSSFKWQLALFNFDNIVILSRTPLEHTNHTLLVLSLLKRAGVALKLKTCAFFMNQIDYVGLVVRPGRLKVANDIIDSVSASNIPTTQNELRSFVGLCNV